MHHLSSPQTRGALVVWGLEPARLWRPVQCTAATRRQVKSGNSGVLGRQREYAEELSWLCGRVRAVAQLNHQLFKQERRRRTEYGRVI